MTLRIFNSGAGSFLPTELPADYFDVIHNAAAANESKFCVELIIKNDQTTATGIYENAEGGTGVCASNLGELWILNGTPWQSQNINYIHDAAAAVNGTQVYFRPDGSSGVSGRLVSNNAGGVNAYCEIVPGTGEYVVVWHDINAAQDSCLLAFDQTRSDGERIRCDDPNAKIFQFVKTNKGRYIQIVSNGTAAKPILYFDDNAADPKKRFLFVSPTASNQINSTVTPNGILENNGAQVLNIYFNQSAGINDRIQTDFGIGIDFYIPIINRVMKIKYNVNAAVDGVPVYFNTTTSKLNFVSPTATSSRAYVVNDRRPYGFLTSGTII